MMAPRDYFALFLFNPVLSLVTAFYNLPNKRVFILISSLVGGFFGFTLISTALETSDSFQHRISFLHSHDYGGLLTYIKIQFLEHGDVVIPLLKYLVRSLSDNSDIFFALIGFLFMLFLSVNYVFLRYTIQGLRKTGVIGICLGISFLTIYSLVSINAVRFPLASQIFIYGMICFVQKREKRGAVFLILSGFTHLGLWIPVFVFGIVFISKQRLLFFSILLLILGWIPYNFISSQSFFDSLSSTNVKAVSKRKNYANEKYINKSLKGASGKNWYVNFRFKFLLLNFSLIILLIYRRFKSQLGSSPFIMFFITGTLLIGFGLLFENTIHSFRRYYLVGMLISIIGIAPIFANNWKLPNLLRYSFIFAVGIYSIVEVRTFFYFTSLDFIVSNPIVAILVKSDFALENLLH